MRQKNDKERMDNMKIEAMHQLGKWRINDDKTQKEANTKLLYHLDRMNTIDNKMKILFNEQLIEQDIVKNDGKELSPQNKPHLLTDLYYSPKSSNLDLKNLSSPEFVMSNKSNSNDGTPTSPYNVKIINKGNMSPKYITEANSRNLSPMA